MHFAVADAAGNFRTVPHRTAYASSVGLPRRLPILRLPLMRRLLAIWRHLPHVSSPIALAPTRSWTSWVKAGSISLGDWVSFCLPWRLKRLKRDFSAVLALLLDAEVPEPQAVTLAAEASANSIFIRRAAAVTADLRSGIKLSEAVRHLDDSGEFRWRLANATQVHGDFSKTLDGWHQALDAKAFQEEQASAQLCTSGVVLFNGLVVGLIATGVFQLLTTILQEGVLW